MRSIFTLIALLSAFSFAIGQSVFPKYEDEPVWCVQEYHFGAIQPEYQITLGADTTICGKQYQPVLIINKPLYNGELYSGTTSYIRQEGQKVYETGLNCRETLLYDFSLGIGDTIYHRSDDFGIVTDIDTIDYHRVTRKTMVIEYPQSGPFPVPVSPIKRTWVEGIGDLFHPFDSPLCLDSNCEFDARLVCFSNNEGIQFGSCSEPCNIPVDTISGALVFPIYEDEPVWCVNDICGFGCIDRDQIREYTYELLPDTMLCGMSYTPILAKNVPNWLPSRDTTDFVVGYIRQEGKQIYQLVDSCQAFLLCDFSLEIGDTITQNYRNYEFKTVVQDIAYQNINGTIRKAYYTIYWSETKFAVGYWIEGLGDVLHTLLDLDCLSDDACEGAFVAGPACISDKNGVQYGTCPENCGSTAGTTSTFSSTRQPPAFSIVTNPIPVGGRLQVQYKSIAHVSGSFLIFNSFGQLLHQQKAEHLTPSENSEINWSPRNTGIYWLTWQGEEGQRQSMKFIVQ